MSRKSSSIYPKTCSVDLREKDDDITEYRVGSRYYPNKRFSVKFAKIILSEADKEAKQARFLSILSLFFCHLWFSIPAIILAFKRGEARSNYQLSIKLSLAAIFVGVCSLAIFVVLLRERDAPVLQRLFSSTNARAWKDIMTNETQANSISALQEKGAVESQSVSLAEMGARDMSKLQSGRLTLKIDKAYFQRQLCDAAGDGNVSYAKMLLDRPFLNINWLDLRLVYCTDKETGFPTEPSLVDGTALHRAIQCRKNNLPMIRMLLAKGADPNVRDRREETPLIWAAKNGFKAVVDLLLKETKKIEIDARNSKLQTALHMGVQSAYDSADIVNILLSKKADMEAQDENGQTPLIYAASLGKPDVTRLLLEHGANSNARNKNGVTVLMYATTYEIAKMLVEKGADVNATDNNGESSLSRALDHGSIEIIRLLVGNGACDERLVSKYSETLIFFAKQNALDLARWLLQAGAHVNTRDEEGETALTWAAKFGYSKMVRLLLAHGAHIDCRNAFNRTALIWASVGGSNNLRTVRLLLDKGSDINAADSFGWTPLLAAVAGGFVDLARLLIERYAEVNLNKAMALAVENANVEMIKLLFERGVSAKSADANNQLSLDGVRMEALTLAMENITDSAGYSEVASWLNENLSITCSACRVVGYFCCMNSRSTHCVRVKYSQCEE